MWVTIEQLRYLKVIAQEGSINAAGAKLGRAKSALYYGIKKLEEQLGYKVLNADKYRVALTPKGIQLLLKIDNFLAEYDSFIDAARQVGSGVEAKLTLSATALYPLNALTKKISQLQKMFSNTEIVFHRELLSGVELLLKDNVDVAILENLKPTPELEVKQIDEVKMHLVISRKHDFIKQKKSSQNLENLLAFPQVIQSSTLPSDESYGVHKHSQQWTVTDIHSKREIILAGLGWGRLPEHDIIGDLEKGRLKDLHHIEKPVKIPIFLGRKKSKFTGAVLESLWEMF
ncbi:MAG: LysR family transcriptional regulator [Bdellovibrionales bacterium]|nr:LysR family transcriptional regulator [Bdellovibrionales bacterium]